jgi:hypothetical protein
MWHFVSITMFVRNIWSKQVNRRIVVLARWRNMALGHVVHVAFMEQLVCISYVHVQSHLINMKELTLYTWNTCRCAPWLWGQNSKLPGNAGLCSVFIWDICHIQCDTCLL